MEVGGERQKLSHIKLKCTGGEHTVILHQALAI